jgi:RNA polymerase sigma-70 factor (ECF subfamily)
VVKTQAGDFEAFARLVSRYEHRVYSLALRMLGDPDEAKDVLQEAFLSALTNIKTLRRGASFATWVFRIAANASLMRIRKRKGRGVESLDEPLAFGEEELSREPEDWSLNPAELYATRELHDALEKAIGELPELYRVVLLLRDVEGFSTAEVSQMVGLSVPAVKSRLLRGRLALRNRLRAFASGAGKR